MLFANNRLCESRGGVLCGLTDNAFGFPTYSYPLVAGRDAEDMSQKVFVLYDQSCSTPLDAIFLGTKPKCIPEIRNK